VEETAPVPEGAVAEETNEDGAEEEDPVAQLFEPQLYWPSCQGAAAAVPKRAAVRREREACIVIGVWDS